MFYTTFKKYSVAVLLLWQKLENSEKSTDLSQVTDKLYHIILCRVHPTMNGVQAHNLSGARIYIVERIRIWYFLALSCVARFNATTAEQDSSFILKWLENSQENQAITPKFVLYIVCILHYTKHSLDLPI